MKSSASNPTDLIQRRRQSAAERLPCRSADRPRANELHRYEAKSPHIPYHHSCVRWRDAAPLDDAASGVDRLHRDPRGRVWRARSDVRGWTGDQKARERGVRRLPSSLSRIGEQRLVRRPGPGEVKTLTVEYTCGATPKRASAAENTPLLLTCR